jgi:plasmid stabilization system protein ParE
MNGMLFSGARFAKLARNYGEGKVIEGNPALRYTMVKRRAKADGHLLVYFVNSAMRPVEVLHIFHSKQDWQNML